MSQKGNDSEENKMIRNKKAVALSYDPNDIAPKVIATGQNYLAEKILNKASEENIPIHKDEKLTDTLSHIELGEYIPPELYQIVAEILVFVEDMDNLKKKVRKEPQEVLKKNEQHSSENSEYK